MSRKFLSMLAFGLVLSGCGKAKKESIGDKISGPFAIASLPNQNSFLVLNSSFSADYEDGSLLRFEVNPDSGKLSKKNALVLPRLGLALAISADEKLAAVAFGGKNSEIRFYDISKIETPVEIENLKIPFELYEPLSQLKFFVPKSAGAGEYYFQVMLNEETQGSKASVDSKVYVGKVSADKKIVPLFTLPDSLYQIKNEGTEQRPLGYTLGYGAPVYLSDLDLFVAFPKSGSGDFLSDNASKLDTPWKLFKNKKPESQYTDLRRASAIVVDFGKFLASKDFTTSAVLSPFAYNDDYTFADMENEANAAANASFRFRQNFYVSEYPRNSCKSLETAPTALTAEDDALLLVDNTLTYELEKPLAEVLAVRGFAALKATIANSSGLTLPAGRGLRVDFHPLTVTPYSRSKEVEGLRGAPWDIKELTTLDSRGATNPKCAPFWVRTNTSGQIGKQNTYLQTNVGRVATNPFQLKTLHPSASVSAALKDYVLTASYQTGALSLYKFNASAPVSSFTSVNE